MKEIKAYIQIHKLQDVTEVLSRIDGLTGDGKIYVADVFHAVRISTGETGESAV